MDEIVKSNGKPQFFLFSGHDTNVANLWSYLRPVNLMQRNELNKMEQWYSVPFSSYVQIELHRNKANGDYLVRFSSNGIVLHLDGLPQVDGFSDYQQAKQFMVNLSFD